MTCFYSYAEPAKDIYAAYSQWTWDTQGNDDIKIRNRITAVLMIVFMYMPVLIRGIRIVKRKCLNGMTSCKLAQCWDCGYYKNLHPKKT